MEALILGLLSKLSGQEGAGWILLVLALIALWWERRRNEALREEQRTDLIRMTEAVTNVTRAIDESKSVQQETTRNAQSLAATIQVLDATVKLRGPTP